MGMAGLRSTSKGSSSWSPWACFFFFFIWFLVWIVLFAKRRDRMEEDDGWPD